MDILELIKERRSVKKYLDKAIPYIDMVKILEAGRWAPRAGNVHDIEFIVVRDRKQINEIANTSYGQYWINNSPLVIIIVSDIEKVRTVFGDQAEKFSIANAWATAQNMVLEAESIGISSCLIGSFDENKIKIKFGIPNDRRVWVMITFGYMLEKPFAPHRLELSYITYFDRYGKRTIF